MPDLTRDLVKDVVRNALSRVADFTGDFESFTFRRFGVFHKDVFLAALKSGLIAIRRNDSSHYDIDLTPDSLLEWENMGGCIDWLFDNAILRKRNTKLLAGEDLEP